MILLYLSCMKCILRCRVGHNLKYIPVLSSLLYFVAFIFIIAYLAPPDSARLDQPESWKDTTNVSYISVVNLIFVALQIAINTVVFFLLVFFNYAVYINVLKLHHRVYNQFQDTAVSRRGSDYTTVVIITSYNHPNVIARNVHVYTYSTILEILAIGQHPLIIILWYQVMNQNQRIFQIKVNLHIIIIIML